MPPRVFMIKALGFMGSEQAGLSSYWGSGYLPGEELRSSRKTELVFQFLHSSVVQVTRS